MLVVEKSSVILPIEMVNDSDGYPFMKRWRTVALAHMVQFSDIDEQVGGRQRKRK
jgi:hypothetical protein